MTDARNFEMGETLTSASWNYVCYWAFTKFYWTRNNKYWLKEFCLNRLFSDDKNFITAVARIFYATCQAVTDTNIHGSYIYQM